MDLGTVVFHDTKKVDMAGNSGAIKTVTKTDQTKQIGGLGGAGTTVEFDFGTWMWIPCSVDNDVYWIYDT